MSLTKHMPYLFESDVTSVKDYEDRMQEITRFISQFQKKDWKIFYRGDRYCAKTQSNFFRNGNIEKEAEIFEAWKKHQEKLPYSDDFMNLAYMQHEQGNTRLLDFSLDPLVALRFACGKQGDNCRKKVTIYCTDHISLNHDKAQRKELLDSYMRLVQSDGNNLNHDSHWDHDVFVDVDGNFPRIKRQKGLFLIMGNFTTAELFSGKDPNGKSQTMKVTHELSENIGRGENCPGYVGVLAIAADCVEKIRRELELMPEYRIDYLMDEETGAHHANRNNTI